MGELRSDIEEYMENPEQEGSEQEKLDQYSSDAKKIIHESAEWQKLIEILSQSEQGKIFLYLINRPGTCCHQFPNKKTYETFRNLVIEGESITHDSQKAEWAVNERGISLHIALSQGISTFQEGAEFTYGTGGNAGFILKPDFLKKITDISDEELQKFEAQIESDPERSQGSEKVDLGKIKLAMNIRGAIEGRSPLVYTEEIKYSIPEKEFDELYKEKRIVYSDAGIRGLTLENGQITPIPIKKEDILYFFEYSDFRAINYNDLDVKDNNVFPELTQTQYNKFNFFNSDGTRLNKQDLSDLLMEANEFNPSDKINKYYNLLNSTSPFVKD